MRQIEPFLEALKKALKARSITYKQLSSSLNLSEASVKRLLTGGKITLDRIEEICRLSGISFIDICRQVGMAEEKHEFFLTKEQEETFAANPRLLNFYILLRVGKPLKKILAKYEIDELEAQKFLLALDRMNLIELHAGNRIKLLGEGSMRFRRDGAVGKAIFENTKNTFLLDDFEGDDKLIRFTLIPTNPALLKKYKSKLERLLTEFHEEARYLDEDDPQTQATGMLIAYRPWHLGQFEAIKKK